VSALRQQQEIQWYGARPSLPDIRDFRAQFTRAQIRAARVAASVRLKTSPFMPPIVDQLPLGACVANATATAFRFETRQAGLPDFQPSRLAIYYGGRKLEGSVEYDSGLYVRDGIKVVAKEGAGDERLWPYDIDRFTETPPAEYYADAAQHRAVVYERVGQTQGEIQAAIHGRDLVVLGIAIYESFESEQVAKTGTVPMPKSSEALLGWHCVAMDGYDPRRTDQANSWNEDWGKRGHFTLKWDYVLNPDLCSDLWRIKRVSQPAA
jgi:C1A family cysteine protease